MVRVVKPKDIIKERIQTKTNIDYSGDSIENIISLYKKKYRRYLL